MIESALGAGMERRDRIRQRGHQGEVETLGGGKPIEDCVLRKPVHLDEPVNG